MNTRKICPKCFRSSQYYKHVEGQITQFCAYCHCNILAYQVSKALKTRRANRVLRERSLRKAQVFGTLKSMAWIIGLMCTVALMSPASLTYTAMASSTEAVNASTTLKTALGQTEPPKDDNEPKTPSEVKNYIISEAEKAGVHVPKIAYIVENESQWKKEAKGDMHLTCTYGPNKGKPVRAKGVWQITDCGHPEISDECAFDVKCSTKWALTVIASSKADCMSQWTTCSNWYKS